jgi:hypothetical protein
VAVRQEQSRLGQPVNGRGGRKILDALRDEKPPQAAVKQ